MCRLAVMAELTEHIPTCISAGAVRKQRCCCSVPAALFVSWTHRRETCPYLLVSQCDSSRGTLKINAALFIGFQDNHAFSCGLPKVTSWLYFGFMNS